MNDTTPSPATAGGFVLDVMQRAKRGYATENELNEAIRLVEAMTEALGDIVEMSKSAEVERHILLVGIHDAALTALARYYGRTES